MISVNEKPGTHTTHLTVCIARIRFELTIHGARDFSVPLRSIIAPFMRNDLPFTDVCRFDIVLTDSIRTGRRSVARNVRNDIRRRFPETVRQFLTNTFAWRAIDIAAKNGFTLTPETMLAFDYGSVLLYDGERHAGFVVQSQEQRESTFLSIDLIVRMLLNVVLPYMQGCIFHASSVLIDGEAHVFLGQSGAGKSTVARMIEPDHVFGDERCIIRRVGKRYYCYTTPWWFEKKDRRHLMRRGKVGSVSFLHKSRRTAAGRCSMSTALTKILSEKKAGQLDYLFTDKHLQKRAVTFYAGLFTHVPVFDLHVKKSAAFPTVFRQLLRERRMS